MQIEGEKNNQVKQLEKISFDAIGLIDNPFCTLSRTQTKERRIQLSANKQHYLVSTPAPPELWDTLPKAKADLEAEKYGMPTALAERVILGLLWMTKDKTRFENETIEFQVRELVERYMYPETYADGKKRAGGKMMRRAENELYRIANTKIVTENWYSRGKRIRMDASIISSIGVLEKGGGTAPKVLRVCWAKELFESIKDQYTKGVSFRKLSKLKPGLELRLYRWLDRQLARKTKEVVHSCQNWARYDLLMKHPKLLAGGRTASTFVVREVQRVIGRLRSTEFPVVFTWDESSSDFTFIFKKPDKPNIFEEKKDPIEELVAYFKMIFHNIEGKFKIYKEDRDFAQNWMEKYGFEKVKQMIDLARKSQKKSRPNDPPKYFRGLAFYEAEVLRRHRSLEKKRSIQKREALEKEAAEAWKTFWEEQLQSFEKKLTETERQLLMNEAVAHARTHNNYFFQHDNQKWKNDAIERSRRLVIQDRLGLDKETFMTRYVNQRSNSLF